MSSVGRVSHLRLVWSAKTPLQEKFEPKLLTTKQLVDHFLKNHHPSESNKKLPLIWKKSAQVENTYELGCEFYGQWVVFEGPTVKSKDFVGHLIEPQYYQPILAVAQKALENTFGTTEEATTTDWMPMAGQSRHKKQFTGPVYGHFEDYEQGSITVITPRGFTLSIKGINILEAAIYLPTYYRQLEEMLIRGEIKEGISEAEIQVEGEYQPYAVAASPIHMGFKAPNPVRLEPGAVGQVVKDGINSALARKTPL
ncbi:hypothetical protein A2291_04015 [candidate division WOR-1 bacterium RIFOXYB2_FULL_42_35]|uniref:Uncharacterized protein n=1 Tax=candidate division WOR-1 bacterium RIFOXYC2_FULL_41_25 TaxID=1802586 RepID=A0A1F4TN97_UNCSA|nr:MAG: hypothetical protein A2247_00855 [candidate division WOR-1 bacterium RIFOXYA2_FULL_41_14]OGC24298.1 MAG: hypothetical protein A2291_04015 [candidate division WOR-1 bacterium RIFOXYB2_FULL_42_35]OGC34000.1 MAG: hypothetical protein A2462_01420 [candidate division WOR-1 bacterium RIFOXYC2_FULL_41_25]OGC43151.1 MAG: hypothetical protein A2548_01790 [candidate division WOR-1 bacterium RIFOXYD2_FULL_41_8]